MESSDSFLPKKEKNDFKVNFTTDDSTYGANLRQFLSNASGSTIGACLMGSCAFLCMFLGRTGLFFTGIAAGIALHVVWERNVASQSEIELGRKKQTETALEVANRVLNWRKSQNEHGANGKLERRTEVATKMAMGQELDFSTFSPCTSSALTELVDAIIRDYVSYWYSPILKEETFPDAARQVLIGFLVSLGAHQTGKRPADALLNFLTNATSIFIVLLSELHHALMVGDGSELETSEALLLYLDRSESSNLFNMANLKEQEKKFLLVTDDLLQSFLDHKTYNCEPARIFLTQIFAGLILPSVLKTISQPDWINSWIVYLLEEGEPELLNAIDVGVERAAKKQQINAEMTQEGMEMPSGTNESKSSLPKQNPETDSRTSGDAMQAAVEEAKRLTEMIQAEEARKSAAINESENVPYSILEMTSSTPSSAEFLESKGESMTTTLQSQSDKSTEVFTNFDQMGPSYLPVPENSRSIPPLTLYQAKITVMDDGIPSVQNIVKNKPQTEYLIQVEPASSLHSGWMVARMYQELEPFHEYLYKIANVTGATSFSRRYQFLPKFGGKSKEVYRQEIERYISDALSHETLAESEGMKKFLDKDQGFRKSNGNKGALGFATPVGDAFQTVGKGVLGGFNTATKGVAAGGQAMFEGVGGLFTNQRKQTSTRTFTISDPTSDQAREQDKDQPSLLVPLPTPTSVSDQHLTAQPSSVTSCDLSGEEEQARNFDEDVPTLPPRAENNLDSAPDGVSQTSTIRSNEFTEFSSTTPQRNSLKLGTKGPHKSQNGSWNQGTSDSSNNAIDEVYNKSVSALTSDDTHSLSTSENHNVSLPSAVDGKSLPLDESETRVAIELMFAAINELFTLSSAWNIRRTLLNAAKNYLLRPGNPSLLSIRDLFQLKMLDTNLSDEAVASHLRKLRQNSLPTEEEMHAWPREPTKEEKDELRIKAKRLLITRGIPQALTSVMGATATNEALGRVFDSLQIERVSRGLMFAILIQAMKTITY